MRWKLEAMLSLQATRVMTRAMGGRERAFGDSATNGKAKTQEPQECKRGHCRLRDTRTVERDNKTNHALKCIREFQHFVGF